MTEQETRDLACKNAAVAFTELHPEYIVCAENSALILQWLLENPDLDKASVSAYERAFEAMRGSLKLRKPEPVPEPAPDPEKMDSETFKQKILIPEFSQRNKPLDPLVRDFFTSHKHIKMCSHNWSTIIDWLYARQLEPSQANLHTAAEACWNSPGLQVSDSYLESLPSSELKKIAEAEFRQMHANDPAPQSMKPLGVSWSRWANER
jgi:hypothetical protein